MEAIKAPLIPIEILYNTKALYLSMEAPLIPIEILYYTVKTLYNVTRYNRISNIRHKIAGNGSFSIKIPSL